MSNVPEASIPIPAFLLPQAAVLLITLHGLPPILAPILREAPAVPCRRKAMAKAEHTYAEIDDFGESRKKAE